MDKNSPPNGSFSEDLVVRCADRIEKINTQHHVYLDAEFRSWQMCRSMRRDFNFMQSKLFFALRSSKNIRPIKNLLLNIYEEGQCLEDSMRSREMPSSTPSVTIQFHLITEESRILYDAILCADKAIAKMNDSDNHEEISDRTYHFRLAIETLKKHLQSCDSIFPKKREKI
jgi:hypothetical protein